MESDVFSVILGHFNIQKLCQHRASYGDPISTFLSIKYSVNIIFTTQNVSSPLIGCQVFQITSWLGMELLASHVQNGTINTINIRILDILLALDIIYIIIPNWALNSTLTSI